MTGPGMLDAVDPRLFRDLAGVQQDLRRTKADLRGLLRRVARHGETPEAFGKRIDLLNRARDLAKLRAALLRDASLEPAGFEATDAAPGECAAHATPTGGAT